MVRVVLNGSGGGGGDTGSNTDALPADVLVDMNALQEGSDSGGASSPGQDTFSLPGTPSGSTGGATVRLATAATTAASPPAVRLHNTASTTAGSQTASRRSSQTTPTLSAAGQPPAGGAMRVYGGGQTVKVDQQRRHGRSPPPQPGCAHAGVQTEAYVPQLPSAHDAHKAHTARGSYSIIRKRHSTEAMAVAARRKSRLRNNRIGPSDHGDGGGLELDAPKRLQARENLRAKLGPYRLLIHDIKRWWRHKRNRRRDPIPIWRHSIKSIEGHFGTAQSSFFVFVRWLFLLNLAQAVAYTFFVVLPMAVSYDYSANNGTFVYYNAFDGGGSAGTSWLFYGGYVDRVPGYRMDLIYILTYILLIGGCFYFILYNIATAVGTTNSSGSLVHVHNRMPFSSSVLASWDFSINSAEGVANLQKGVSNAIEDLLIDEKAKERAKLAKEFSLRENLDIFLRRLLAWFLWLILLAGAFAGVWYVVQDSRDASEDQNIWDTYGSVIIFSLINGALPVFVKHLPDFEKYKHPRTIVQLTIIRTFLLRKLTIYALLYGYFERTKLNKVQLPPYEAGKLTAQENCAGTIIGQEIYKLLLVDTVVSIVQRYLSTLFYYYYYKRRVELEIIQSVLSLTYRQGLIWAGMVFCPVLPLLAALTNVIYFYFFLVMVKALCRSPFKRYYSNRNNVFFMLSLFATLLMIVIPVAWSLWVYDPNCGPYGPPQYSSPFDAIWEWVKDQDDAFQDTIETLSNPVVVTGFFMALTVWITMLKVRLRRRKNMHRETLRELLQLRADKRFLMSEQSGNVGRRQALDNHVPAAWAEGMGEADEDNML